MPVYAARNTKRARSLRNNATDAERLLWSKLRARQLDGWKFSRQMPIGLYFVDFLCREARLVIEIDGGQHSVKVDRARTSAIEAQGCRVIRFWNNEVRDNLDGVMQAIAAALPTPSPSRRREGDSL